MSKKNRNKGQGPKKPYQSRGELKNQATSLSAQNAPPQTIPQPPSEIVPPKPAEPVAAIPAPKIEQRSHINLPEPAPVQFREATPPGPPPDYFAFVQPLLATGNRLFSSLLKSLEAAANPAPKVEAPKSEASKIVTPSHIHRPQMATPKPAPKETTSEPLKTEHLNLARWLFGISIPLLSFLLMLALPAAGLAYFFIATLAYIIYTVARDEVRRDRNAILTLVKFTTTGVLLAIGLTLLSHHLPFGIIFPLFPPSVLWIVFGDTNSFWVHAGMHTAAILSNAFMYLLYGCIYHHFRTFLAKREAAP